MSSPQSPQVPIPDGRLKAAASTPVGSGKLSKKEMQKLSKQVSLLDFDSDSDSGYDQPSATASGSASPAGVGRKGSSQFQLRKGKSILNIETSPDMSATAKGKPRKLGASGKKIAQLFSSKRRSAGVAINSSKNRDGANAQESNDPDSESMASSGGEESSSLTNKFSLKTKRGTLGSPQIGRRRRSTSEMDVSEDSSSGSTRRPKFGRQRALSSGSGSTSPTLSPLLSPRDGSTDASRANSNGGIESDTLMTKHRRGSTGIAPSSETRRDKRRGGIGSARRTRSHIGVTHREPTIGQDFVDPVSLLTSMPSGGSEPTTPSAVGSKRKSKSRRGRSTVQSRKQYAVDKRKNSDCSPTETRRSSASDLIERDVQVSATAVPPLTAKPPSPQKQQRPSAQDLSEMFLMKSPKKEPTRTIEEITGASTLPVPQSFSPDKPGVPIPQEINSWVPDGEGVPEIKVSTPVKSGSRKKGQRRKRKNSNSPVVAKAETTIKTRERVDSFSRIMEASGSLKMLPGSPLAAPESIETRDRSDSFARIKEFAQTSFGKNSPRTTLLKASLSNTTSPHHSPISASPDLSPSRSPAVSPRRDEEKQRSSKEKRMLEKLAEITKAKDLEMLKELLLDGKLLLVGKCFKVAKETHWSILAKNFVLVFEANHRSINLLRWALREEIRSTTLKEQLFRLDSAASKLVGEYTKLCAVDFLKLVLKNSVIKKTKPAALKSSGWLDKDNKLPESRVWKLVSGMLGQLVSDMEKCPFQLRVLSFYIFDEVEKRFPGKGAQGVGAFFFLRLICPAIVSPKVRGITSSEIAPVQLKALVSVARCVQQLVNRPDSDINGGATSEEEEFVTKNVDRIQTFLDNVGTKSLEGLDDSVIQSLKVGEEEESEALKEIMSFVDGALQELSND